MWSAPERFHKPASSNETCRAHFYACVLNSVSSVLDCEVRERLNLAFDLIKYDTCNECCLLENRKPVEPNWIWQVQSCLLHMYWLTHANLYCATTFSYSHAIDYRLNPAMLQTLSTFSLHMKIKSAFVWGIISGDGTMTKLQAIENYLISSWEKLPHIQCRLLNPTGVELKH